MNQSNEDAIRCIMKRYHKLLMDRLSTRDFAGANQALGSLAATTEIYEEMTKAKPPRHVEYEGMKSH